MIQHLTTIKNERFLLSERDSGMTPSQDQLVVPSLNRYDILNWDDIIFLQAQGNYTHIVCVDNKSYCFSKVLKYVSNKIESDLFLKCHRSYVINTSYLKSICSSELGYHCTMKNDSIIPISRKNKSVIKAWINQRV